MSFLKSIPKIMLIIMLFTLAGTGLMLHPLVKQSVRQFYNNYLSSIPGVEIVKNHSIKIKKQVGSNWQTLQKSQWQDHIDDSIRKIEIPSFSSDKKDLEQYKLAETLYNNGDYKKTLSIYCDLAEKHPDNPETLYSIALAFAKNQAYEEAYIYMMKASERMDAHHPETAKKWVIQALKFQQIKRDPFVKTSEDVNSCHNRLIAVEKKLQQEK